MQTLQSYHYVETQMNEEPYITKEVVVIEKLYNPNYGDDRICECGHKYYRHFDTYENMSNVGCKYCFCGCFTEFKGDAENLKNSVKEKWPKDYEQLIEYLGKDCDEETFIVKLLEINYNGKS